MARYAISRSIVAEGYGLILGEMGNDSITGGAGSDFLLGGDGADRLIGSAGNDILASGYFGCSTTKAMLDAILAAWTDKTTDVTEEAAADAVFEEDGDYDMLTGSSGADWFIIGNNDKITDLAKLSTKGSDGDQITYVS